MRKFTRQGVRPSSSTHVKHTVSLDDLLFPLLYKKISTELIGIDDNLQFRCRHRI